MVFEVIKSCIIVNKVYIKNERLQSLRYCCAVLVLHSPELGFQQALRNQSYRHTDTEIHTQIHIQTNYHMPSVHAHQRVTGVSMSKLHIDHDNGPCTRNNGIYLCILYPAFVAPWFLRSVYALKCSMYSSIIDVVHVCNCQDRQKTA